MIGVRNFLFPQARHVDGLGDGVFKVVRLGQKDLISKVISALENGEPLMIENLGEKIDAALLPVVQRATIKRGRKQFIQIGDKEVDFHEDFKLYLHTSPLTNTVALRQLTR